MDKGKVKKMANHWKINMDYLPIKLHYFFFIGGISGVLPYLPILAKSLGINATAVGLLYTVLPFCVFLSKPFFGFLTDYFQNIKVIVCNLIVLTATSSVCMLFIPAIESSSSNYITTSLKCEEKNQLHILPIEYDIGCLETTLKKGVAVELAYQNCDDDNFTITTGNLLDVELENSFNNAKCVSNKEQPLVQLSVNITSNFSCGCIKTNSSFIRSSKPSIASCFCMKEEEETSLVYRSFWIFMFLVVLVGACSGAVISLSDAACYEVLGSKPELFGRQRLWATVSWGTIVFFAGFLNDLATGTKEIKVYSSGFYLMLVLLTVDFLLLQKIELTKANFSINICKDVGLIFASHETVIFAFTVYITGIFSGLLWNYEFWFLQDMGATQTLLGLTSAVQCLVAEVPMLYFSGWFIKVFGHFYCVLGSLVAFAIRFVLYYLIQNPWLILPVELLHSVTFALFYAAMTGYASVNAPKGTEATMLGTFGGLFEGLGVATGSLLGGVGFDKLGGRRTFLVAGLTSGLCVPAILAVSIFIKRGLCERGAWLNAPYSSRKPNEDVSNNKL